MSENDESENIKNLNEVSLKRHCENTNEEVIEPPKKKKIVDNRRIPSGNLFIDNPRLKKTSDVDTLLVSMRMWNKEAEAFFTNEWFKNSSRSKIS